MIFNTFLFVLLIICFAGDLLLPILIDEYMTDKRLITFKSFHNECVEPEMRKKIRLLINNYDYFRDIRTPSDIGDIDLVLQRLRNYKEKKIFLQYSLEYNMAIFVPIILPIMLNIYVLHKKKPDQVIDTLNARHKEIKAPNF